VYQWCQARIQSVDKSSDFHLLGPSSGRVDFFVKAGEVIDVFLDVPFSLFEVLKFSNPRGFLSVCDEFLDKFVLEGSWDGCIYASPCSNVRSIFI